jgi:hypothetical protein
MQLHYLQNSLVGYCLCEEPVYYNSDENKMVFTCAAAPCNIVKDANGTTLTREGFGEHYG